MNQVSRQLAPLIYSHPPKTLTTLHLRDNNIRAEGAKHLGDALKINHVNRQHSPLFYSPYSH